MQLQFTYNLSGVGWADAFIKNEFTEKEFVASYLYDSLKELIQGINKIIYNEADSADIIFMDEPGEHKMTISRIESEKLLIDLKWTMDWPSYGDASDESYESVFSGVTTIIEFGRLIL